MRLTIYGSALLKDGKLFSWRVGRSEKKTPYDFCKDFYYGGYNGGLEGMEVKSIAVETDDELNNWVFSLIQDNFFKLFEPHPEHLGVLPWEDRR